MKRILAILAACCGALICCGCGDAPVQVAAIQKSAPPKPAPPPAGAPAETPVKPGTEAPPTQLGGPQLKQLMGIAATGQSVPAAGDTTNVDPAAAAPPPASSVDPSAPTQVVPAPVEPMPSAPAAPVPAVPSNGPLSYGPPAGRGNSAGGPNVAPLPVVDPSAPTAGQTAVPLQPGFTGKGQDYGNGDAGLYTVPISTLFAVKEQIVLQQIERAMNVFKTFNGRNPKSEEEFMKEIIKENAIKLPELPEGSKYHYDPASGQLMIVSPKTK